LKGGGSIDGEGTVQVELDISTGGGDRSSTWSLNERSRDLDLLSGSVNVGELWEDVGKVVSGDFNLEELLEESGDVEGVAGIESRLEQGVGDILGEVDLERFAVWVVDWEVSSLGGVHLWFVDVPEGSVDVSLTDISVGEDTTFLQGVVEGDSSEVWDGNRVSVLLEVWVDGGVEGLLDSVLNSGDDSWDDGVLDEWHENGGNFSDGSSGKLDIDVVWVDIDVGLEDVELWGQLVVISWLSGSLDVEVDSNLPDVDFGLTMDGEDVGEGEVGSDGSGGFVNLELETVVLSIEAGPDVAEAWLWELDLDVSELSV